MLCLFLSWAPAQLLKNLKGWKEVGGWKVESERRTERWLNSHQLHRWICALARCHWRKVQPGAILLQKGICFEQEKKFKLKLNRKKSTRLSVANEQGSFPPSTEGGSSQFNGGRDEDTSKDLIRGSLCRGHFSRECEYLLQEMLFNFRHICNQQSVEQVLLRIHLSVLSSVCISVPKPSH